MAEGHDISIEKQLKQAHQQERRWYNIRGISRVIVWLIALLAVDFIIDWGLFAKTGMSGGIGIFLLLVNLGVLGWVLWHEWLRHIKSYDAVTTALDVEKRHPGLTSLLVSYMQLKDGPSSDQENVSQDLINAMRDQAIERSRPRPGRLRWASVAAVTAAVAAVLLLWLPGALQRHAVSVVPEIKRQEIGRQILGRIERVTGRACAPEESLPALNRLAQRTGVRRVVVLPGGIAESLHLPGGIVVLNRTLIEDHEDPAVAAGHILLERARAEAKDPLAELLDHAGPVASFRLLTTGQMTPESLDRYAETAMSAPRPALADDAVLAVFAQAAVPSSPFAYAQDVTGESVLGLIEADPMTGRTLEPVIPDRDWIRLQGICDG